MEICFMDVPRSSGRLARNPGNENVEGLKYVFLGILFHSPIPHKRHFRDPFCFFTSSFDRRKLKTPSPPISTSRSVGSSALGQGLASEHQPNRGAT